MDQGNLSQDLKTSLPPCFKAYDIRGRVPDELNADLCHRLGRALAVFLAPRTVVVGRDIRLSSPALADALSAGLLEAGVDVLDLGECGTEQVYFYTSFLQADGGVMLTASHNPSDYNGMKLVREESRPISGDTGLHALGALALRGGFPPPAAAPGRRLPQDPLEDYTRHLLSYVDLDVLKPLTVVVNAGNGGAGAVLDRLEQFLPFRFIKIYHEPDGTFPHGVPNPLLPGNRQATMAAVREHGADLGLAWDGDFDRCFLVDEQGDFIEGYYIVGFLAQALLARHPGEKIIHDPRLVWNTLDVVRAAGGVPVLCKAGHAFIKERMRRENALYGGEMSAHHYFRDFFYCDSGMIPWLLVTEHLCRTGQPLSALVAERLRLFPISGEINRQVADPAAVLARVAERYGPEARSRDDTDGLGLEFARWRFNLRPSNTEPVLRLNVETRQDPALLEEKTAELLALIV